MPSSCEDLYRIHTREHKFGYVNQSGATVIEPVYDDAGHFAEGLSYVGKDDRLWIINARGELGGTVSDAKGALCFSDNHLVFTRRGKYGVLDSQAKVIVPPVYDLILPVLDGRFVIKQRGLYGIQSLDRSWRVTPHYSVIYQFTAFSSVTSAHRTDGALVIIDDNGTLLTDRTFASGGLCSDGVIPVMFSEADGGDLGWVDTTGEPVFRSKEFDQFGSCFQSRTILARVGDNWGALSIGGEVVVPPIYPMLGDLCEGMRMFCASGGEDKQRRWGFLNARGEIAIEPRFSFVGDFQNGIARAHIGPFGKHERALVNKHGTIIWRDRAW